jgi:hypothetical protein
MVPLCAGIKRKARGRGLTTSMALGLHASGIPEIEINYISGGLFRRSKLPHEIARPWTRNIIMRRNVPLSFVGVQINAWRIQ